MKFDIDTDLTPHFKMGEVCVSQTKPGMVGQCREDIKRCDMNRAYLLAVMGLEPIRERFGLVLVTSWYRSKELNAAVGGSATTQHLYGEVADIVVPDAGVLAVYKYLDKVWPGELILYSKHLHIALPRWGVKPDHMIGTYS